MDKRHWEHGPCPKHDCRKGSCKCGLRLISFPAALGDDSKGSPVAPKNGDYCNALVKYESNGHIYVYSTEGVPERLSSNGTLNFEELLNRPQYNGGIMTGETNIPEVPSAVSQLTNNLGYQTEGEVNSTVASAVAGEAAARQQADNTLQSAITRVSNALGSETTARRNADNNLQSQIDGISASSDVKDIVGTYAELQAYDTSTLGDNDIIKVLQDETHSDETTYYRWSTATQTFTLIGEEGPYYTKSRIDELLGAKQNTLTAGANITISDDTISAIDTTYSAFTGTDGQTAGTSGLVPAPATTDADKFLKSDGTWGVAGGGGSTVVQTTGTSTTDVMSQNATTSMVYADPAAKTQIQLGNSTSSNLNTVSIGNNIVAEGARAIAIGDRTDDTIVTASGASAISIGVNNSSTGGNGIAIGVRANATGDGSIAWGTYATSSGLYALATHYQSEASGKYSSAIGPYAKALRDSSMAFGLRSEANGIRGIAVGECATTDAEGSNNMAVGYYASATGDGSMAVGLRASSTAPNALALGAYSSATQQGEMNIGTTNTAYGYNNSNYRLLSGVYDPQSDHDAATKGYVDNSLSGKQDTLTAGSNISISGNTISATDTTYTAGNGLDLTGTVFSVDTDVVATQTGLSTETTNRENADLNLQSQIDAITVSSDVVDILGTYADLQNYDTAHIKANDIIKVIQDETHNDAMSYYRWVITNNVGAWSYVGSEGPFYTKSETDTLLNAKANTSDIIVYTAGTGISIQNGVISLSLTSAESESF